MFTQKNGRILLLDHVVSIRPEGESMWDEKGEFLRELWSD